MRVAFVVLLVLAIAMSGCTQKKDGDGSDTNGTATSSGTGSGSKGTASSSGSTSGSGTGAPALRTASLTASVANGTAPFNVTFTLDASGGPTSWQLAFGDGGQANGTKFPASENHTFEAAGLFQANVTVRFATGPDLVRNVTINVTGDAPPGPIKQVPFSAEGLIVFGTQGDGIAVFNGCGFTGTEDFDIAKHTWDLGPASGAVSVQKIVVHMDLGMTNVDSDIDLLGPDGTAVGGSADFNQPGLGTGSPTEDFEVVGPLASGTYTFVVKGCVTAGGEYTITATADVTTA